MLGKLKPSRVPVGIAWVLASFHGVSAYAEPAPSTENDSAPVASPAAERSLEERVKRLEDANEALSARMEGEAMENMVADAMNEARAAAEQPKPEDRAFLEGGLALQKLNPEITFVGDVLAALVIDGDKFYAGESDRSGMPVRAVGLHFQHVLDPYSMFKSSFHVCPQHGLHLEEVYISWFGVIPSLSFTLGRFRQGFGVLNRWHEHDLDQTQYPMALTQVLGEEGLMGDGFSVKWLMPSLWAHVNELTLEVVNGTNTTLFSGEHFTLPSTLLHLKNYYDLSSDTYLELGLTGMFGFNNRRGLASGTGALVDEPWRTTYVGGADLTVYWSPTSRAKYRSLVWRSELFFVEKETTDSSTDGSRSSWGAYSYIQYQPAERWFAGLRGDASLPTVREHDDVAWDVVPYLTYWQSEFVYLRLEYRHGRKLPYQTPEGGLGRRTDNRVLFQISFAAGPHKHEKY